jgi:hypothetical protein
VALSILFIHFYCPETEGKTLEETAKFFEWDSNHRISSSSGDGEFASKQSEDLHLIGHDGLSIVDETVAQRQLLSKVCLIANQRLNEQ